MTAFNQAFDLVLKNERDRVDLGTVSTDGVIAYPLESKKNRELRDLKEGGFTWGRPHNVEAFRNIDINVPHIAPGLNLHTGQIRPNTGVLSILRGGQETIGIANALPLRNPFFRVNENKQMDAWLGRKQKNTDARGNANRTAHMWTAGDLTPDELQQLYSGERTPMDILGMHEEMQLGRNQAGDAMMAMGSWEAPRFGYTVYDIKDSSLPPKQKWKPSQRLPLRQDFGMPWREARRGGVSGSVDPLLQIPIGWSDFQPNRPGQRYVEYTDPRSGYTFDGIPVPLSLTAGNDFSVSALDRGIATGTHGLYFDPNDLTTAGRELWDTALTGDIIRRSMDIFKAAWDECKEV
ncbi:MAG: hypothetical protein CMI60_04290 [Parvibaculum sp.]|nr:hypothetical protein [Parvibaculum sp.]